MASKPIDMQGLKEIVAKLGDAIDVLEQSGNAKKELDAIKAEVVRFQADRDKIIDGIKKQAQAEARATADKILADANAAAKSMTAKTQSEANAHYNSVKADAKRLLDGTTAEVDKLRGLKSSLNNECAVLQEKIADLGKLKDEALGKMRDLAKKFAA